MSNNIGKQDGNQLNIKLYNGKTISLSNLDKLVGKYTAGSVFSKFDYSQNGGITNNVFDEAEIARIKNTLLQYQSNDNMISQEELNQIFGYGQSDESGNKKNFDVNSLSAYFDEVLDEPSTTPRQENPIKAEVKYEKYTVQPGDTPEVIAQKLGLTGDDAKTYADKLRARLKSQNQLSKQGWLMVGQKIDLEEGAADKLKQSSNYSEDMEVLEDRYAQTEHAQKISARQIRSQRNSVNHRVNIPDTITQRAAEISKNGGKCQIVRNSDGGFSIIQTSGGNYMKNHKIASIELRYDKTGKMSSQINNMQNGSVLEGKWANGKMNWKVTKKPVEIKAPKGKTPAENMSQAERSRMLMMNELRLPENLQNKIINLRMQGIECNVEKIKNGYRMSLDEDKMNFKNPNWNRILTPEFFRDKKSLILDSQGNIVQQNQLYNNRQVITKYENGKPVYTETRYKKAVSYNKKVDAQRTIDSSKIPTKIEINRPEHLNEVGNKFADSLEKNKSKIMSTLGITNEQYDNLANLAMGIAEQETHFGAKTYTTQSGETTTQWRNIAKQTMDAVYYNDSLPGFIKDTIFDVGGSLSSSVEEFHGKYTDGTKSYGITQVKVDEFIKDNPTLKKQFAAFGIHSGEDIRTSPEKQAIATMIVLNNKRIVAETGAWQARLEKNNANISDKGQQITQNDLIALLYNGNSSKLNLLKDANLSIKDAAYARNVRAYTSNYYAIKHDESSQRRADILGVESQGNNGKIGTVIFMPSAYTTNVANSKKDIQTLESALQNNPNMPKQLKDNLLAAVRKNEIAFGYGLTAEEASSITQKDAQLILGKLDGLKARVSNLIDPARIRSEAEKTQSEFRKNYLESRQVIVNEHDVPSSSIIPALASGDVVNERLQARGERSIIINAANVKDFRRGANGRSHVTANDGQYRGFKVEADKGVNPYDANGNYLPKQQRVLAECASDVAAMMDCGGNCTTGVKASLQSAKVVNDRSKIGFKNPDGSWNKCENAKDLATYYSKHPELFEEVKYVSLGDGTARELNATDIKNLPAGYLGVFIPGKGYEHQAGHAFITNGNGQGYADETDNLRWDDFKSRGIGDGKGEHGTYRIFRLKV